MGDTEKIRCLCEKWHAGELSDRALALSVVLELGGVGDCYTSIDDWKRALDLEMSIANTAFDKALRKALR